MKHQLSAAKMAEVADGSVVRDMKYSAHDHVVMALRQLGVCSFLKILISMERSTGVMSFIYIPKNL